MKNILTCLFLLLGFFCSAQNYNCFVPGKRQYFINDHNYVRGMRIDSVIVSGADTIYYPFHTPRGSYDRNYTWEWHLPPPLFDPNGGSWLGKKVIKKTDGTFLFDNLWNDTLIIKTQAGLGDSWRYYDDISSRYYIATVSAIDTMTIENSIDSIKTITIAAYQNGVMNPTDSINGFPIILSKNNGFVHIHDMYTFPYHAPDTTNYDSYGGIDYYLDLINANAGSDIYIKELPLGPQKYGFHLISFIAPTRSDLYSWSVGDVYEYYSAYEHDNVDSAIGFYMDTINAVTTFPDHKEATYSGWKKLPAQPYPHNYILSLNSGTFTAYDTLIFDTTKMPEEYGQTRLLYYYPKDTSFCMRSPAYDVTRNIELTGFQYNGQAYLNQEVYKQGLGLLTYEYGFNSQDESVFEINMLEYYYKNNLSCGQISEGLTNLNSLKEIKLFPNPATNNLNISLPNINHGTYSISLINTLGQVIRNTTTSEEKTTIGVGNIPNGLYDVMIVSEDGERVNQKVIVDH